MAPGGSSNHGSVGVAVRAAELDEPAGRAGRRCERCTTSGVPSSPTRVERGGERARRVDDDEVAFVEELRQIVRVRVHEPQVERCATIIRTASRVMPRASGGSVASRTHDGGHDVALAMR